MVRFFENHQLKPYNTFNIEAKAKYFFEFTEVEDLKILMQSKPALSEEKLLVIGEGSNILFMDDFDGLVINPNIPGIYTVDEDSQDIWLEAGAGESWDEFVDYCVRAGFGGVENLSSIPGKVGAAPVQNIGAYGMEAADVIHKVKGFDMARREMLEFTNKECGFGYRDSIFKRDMGGSFVITSVVFKLDKFPVFKLGYSDLEAKVNELGGVSVRNVKKAVDEIRSSKLPDVKKLGSAGSFFKNPVVDASVAQEIVGEYGKAPVYPAGEGKVKIAAGWLVENAGWKGFRNGDAGVHDRQALVLVNYGKATGKQIYDLSEKIKQSVLDKFGVSLEREVNCV